MEDQNDDGNRAWSVCPCCGIATDNLGTHWSLSCPCRFDEGSLLASVLGKPGSGTPGPRTNLGGCAAAKTALENVKLHKEVTKIPEKTVAKLPQNVTPNRVVVEGNNIYYGNQGESTHGHTVVKNGEIAYARTRGGRKLK